MMFFFDFKRVGMQHLKSNTIRMYMRRNKNPSLSLDKSGETQHLGYNNFKPHNKFDLLNPKNKQGNDSRFNQHKKYGKYRKFKWYNKSKKYGKFKRYKRYLNKYSVKLTQLVNLKFLFPSRKRKKVVHLKLFRKYKEKFLKFKKVTAYRRFSHIADLRKKFLVKFIGKKKNMARLLRLRRFESAKRSALRILSRVRPLTNIRSELLMALFRKYLKRVRLSGVARFFSHQKCAARFCSDNQLSIKLFSSKVFQRKHISRARAPEILMMDFSRFIKRRKPKKIIRSFLRDIPVCYNIYDRKNPDGLLFLIRLRKKKKRKVFLRGLQVARYMKRFVNRDLLFYINIVLQKTRFYKKFRFLRLNPVYFFETKGKSNCLSWGWHEMVVNHFEKSFIEVTGLDNFSSKSSALELKIFNLIRGIFLNFITGGRPGSLINFFMKKAKRSLVVANLIIFIKYFLQIYKINILKNYNNIKPRFLTYDYLVWCLNVFDEIANSYKALLKKVKNRIQKYQVFERRSSLRRNRVFTRVYINFNRNNVFFTVTNHFGRPFFAYSCGISGAKGKDKINSYYIYLSSIKVFQKIVSLRRNKLYVFFFLSGHCNPVVLNFIFMNFNKFRLRAIFVKNHTPLPFSHGLRARKPRRI